MTLHKPSEKPPWLINAEGQRAIGSTCSEISFYEIPEASGTKLSTEPNSNYH